MEELDVLLQSSVFNRKSILTQPRSWREEDIEQRILENARYLWDRFLRESRLALDEHADQLRGLAQLSALLASFGIIAFIQFGFDPTQLHLGLLITFAVANALTITLNVSCMTTCSLLLACTYRIFTTLLTDDQEAIYMQTCREYARLYEEGDSPPSVGADFQKRWNAYFLHNWHATLFMFCSGVVMFLVNIACAGFIKFKLGSAAGICVAVPLGVAFLYFIVAHQRWFRHLMSLEGPPSKIAELEGELEPRGLPFDWHRPGKVYGPGSSLVKGASSVRVWQDLQPAPSSHLMDPASAFQRLQVLWRAQDREQTALENARLLWQRHVKNVVEDAEERGEQLHSFAFLAGIMAGFGMAALLQLTFPQNTVSPALQTGFAISVALTGSCSISCMAMCALILLSILQVVPSLVSREEECVFLFECRSFAAMYKPGDRPPACRRDFRGFWAMYHADYVRAFAFFLMGLCASLVQLVFAAFIKYMPVWSAATAAASIVAATLAYLWISCWRMVAFLLRHRKELLIQISAAGPTVAAGLPFDWHAPPRAAGKKHSEVLVPGDLSPRASGLDILRHSIVQVGRVLGLDDASDTASLDEPSPRS